MKSKAFLTTIIFLFFLCGAAVSEEYGTEISVSVDRAAALIGDRIKFSVDIEHHSNVEIKLPEFKDNKLGNFEIKDSGGKNLRELIGGDLMKRWYFIAAYSPGKYQIPPIEIRYRKKGDKDWKTALTKTLNVTIASVLPKDKPAADIKDVKKPLSYFEINFFLIIGVVLLIAAITSAILYKFRKKKPPIRLPHETALEELEAIRANFLKNSDIKEYYAGISDCVRRYIERSFRLRAPEMTTEEFLSSLKVSTALPLDQKDLLKDFLSACDLVKFARYNPAKGEMETVFQAAKKFIDMSTPGADDVRV